MCDKTPRAALSRVRGNFGPPPRGGSTVCNTVSRRAYLYNGTSSNLPIPLFITGIMYAVLVHTTSSRVYWHVRVIQQRAIDMLSHLPFALE